MPWQSPTLAVKWGPYFAPDPTEQTALIAMVQEALGGKGGKPLIQLRQAVEKIAPIFGITNIEATVKAVEEEQAKRDAAEVEKSANEAKALAAVVPPKPTAKP